MTHRRCSPKSRQPGTISSLGLVALVALALAACGGSNPTGTSGGVLVVELTWNTAGNMDVGATTPNGIIAANFPGDPACTHTGDDGGTGAGSFSERMTCDPSASGDYVIVVENYSAQAITFTLQATTDGANVSGFPLSESLGANQTLSSGTPRRVTFTLQ